jgi:phage gp36-like protein
MVTRTADTSQKSTNGSQPISLEHATETATETISSAVDTLSTFVQVSQRVGSEVLDSTTAAFRDGLELSAKLQSAVLDATREMMGSVASSSTQSVENWNRLLDTSTRAYGDYATRVTSVADDAAVKIRDAVQTLSDEVSAKVASIGH